MAQTPPRGASAPRAQLRACTPALESVAPPVQPPPPAPPTVATLALQAADRADQLSSTLDAFRALEHLTAPTGREDSERLEPTRTQMGALLRVLNDELERQTQALASTTDELRTAARGGL